MREHTRVCDRIRDPKITPQTGCYKEPNERNNGTNKGAWGMPRLSEAKKDVTSCEKPRGEANTP